MLKKKAEVVLLPTKQESQIIKGDNINYLTIPDKWSGKGIPQHLYFIDNSSIKEGDWCINKNRDTLYQINGIPTTIEVVMKDWKKVIATTNSELRYNPYPVKEFDTSFFSGGKSEILKIPNLFKLPQPSDSFIAKYVKAYNNSTPIVNVMIEYEGFECKNEHYMSFHAICSYPHCDEYNFPKLKVDKNNRITITHCKESWSREEVVELCKNFHSTIGSNNDGFYTISELNKWIEKNL